MIWCCSLTPVHVFTPTFMDIWTSYANHPTLKPSDILYDAGEAAMIEYERILDLLSFIANYAQCFRDPRAWVKR